MIHAINRQISLFTWTYIVSNCCYTWVFLCVMYVICDRTHTCKLELCAFALKGEHNVYSLVPNSFLYWPKVNLYQVVFGQQSVWTLFKSLAQSFCKCSFKKKWPPVAILDVQKSLVTISDQYHNLYFCDFFYKMAAGGHSGCPKLTFDGISGHFRSIRNFFFKTFFQNGRRRPFWIPEIHFWTHFWPFQIDMQLFIFDKMTAVDHISVHFRSMWIFFFDKMAACAHFGCPKFTFDRISGHFRSIRNFICFGNFDKMAAVGHFVCPKFTSDRISGHFRSIRNFYFFGNFWQNGCRRPFWMSEIHFRSHFWPF